MRENTLIIFDKPNSHFAEAFRVLRTNIDFSSADDQFMTLLITSPGPKEGKSTTAANLALAISQTGKKVVLIDADLRHPTLYKIFDVSNEIGLTNILIGRVTAESVMQEIHGIYLITSGPLPPNPSELLSSQRMEEMLKNLQQTNDILLLDSPPLNYLSDAAILAGKLDGTILVIDSNKTPIDHAREAKEQLKKVRANIIGVVLNKINTKSSRYYYHNYYYSKQEQSDKGAHTND